MDRFNHCCFYKLLNRKERQIVASQLDKEGDKINSFNS